MQSHGLTEEQTSAAESSEREGTLSVDNRSSSEDDNRRWSCLDCGKSFGDTISFGIHAGQQNCASWLTKTMQKPSRIESSHALQQKTAAELNLSSQQNCGHPQNYSGKADIGRSNRANQKKGKPSKGSKCWVCGLCNAVFYEEFQLTVHMVSHKDHLTSDFQMDIENTAETQSCYLNAPRLENAEGIQDIGDTQSRLINKSTIESMDTTGNSSPHIQSTEMQPLLDSEKILELNTLSDFDIDIFQ